MLDGQRVRVSVAHFENDMHTPLVHLGYDEVDEPVSIPNEEIRREFAVAVETDPGLACRCACLDPCIWGDSPDARGVSPNARVSPLVARPRYATK